MKLKFPKIFAAFAILMLPGVAQGGVAGTPLDDLNIMTLFDVTINETISGDGTLLQYSITNNGLAEGVVEVSPDTAIDGFAIEFALPEIFELDQLLDPSFSFGLPEGVTGFATVFFTGDISGDASDLFSLDQAVFFGFDGGLGIGETLGLFTLGISGEEVAVFSSFAVTCSNPDIICATGEAVTAAPEPGTLALFGIGAIGIGAAVRRRRQTA